MLQGKNRQTWPGRSISRQVKNGRKKSDVIYGRFLSHLTNMMPCKDFRFTQQLKRSAAVFKTICISDYFTQVRVFYQFLRRQAPTETFSEKWVHWETWHHSSATLLLPQLSESKTQRVSTLTYIPKLNFPQQPDFENGLHAKFLTTYFTQVRDFLRRRAPAKTFSEKWVHWEIQQPLFYYIPQRV